MAEHELAIIVNSLVATIALVTWWFWFHADYALDKFRQDVFVLRDELFDYAASGAVPFDSPAYSNLRLLLNRVTRYAHRVTFWQAIGFSFVESFTEEDKRAASSFEREWRTSVNSIADPDVRDKLNAFEHRLMKLIVWRVVSTSIAAMLLILLSGIFHIGKLSVDLIAKLLRADYLQERAWRRA